MSTLSARFAVARKGLHAGASALLLLGAGFCTSPRAQDTPDLALYYYERPPFHFTDAQGRVVGSIAANAEDTLRRAQLRFHWVQMPASRVLNTLRSDPLPACSPGWYRTPDREADFWISRPMQLDKPLIALLRADYAVPPDVTAPAFFQAPRLRLLLKRNFSQGAYMNALIARMPAAQVQQVGIEVPQMVRMLSANRADAIITTEAEAALFVYAAGLSMRDFKIVRFPDVPAEEFRHLLCGRAVNEAVLARIDKSIVLDKP